MMMILINIIGISFLLIHYDEFINIFNDILKNYKRILLLPKKILECFKCTTFWVSLIMTGDIGLSAFLSLIGFIIDKYIISSGLNID